MSTPAFSSSSGSSSGNSLRREGQAIREKPSRLYLSAHAPRLPAGVVTAAAALCCVGSCCIFKAAVFTASDPDVQRPGRGDGASVDLQDPADGRGDGGSCGFPAALLALPIALDARFRARREVLPAVG